MSDAELSYLIQSKSLVLTLSSISCSTTVDKVGLVAQLSAALDCPSSDYFLEYKDDLLPKKEPYTFLVDLPKN